MSKRASLRRLSKSAGLDPDEVGLALLDRGVVVDNVDAELDTTSHKAARAVVRELSGGPKVVQSRPEAPSLGTAAEQLAQEVADPGDLAGLAQLTQTIAAMETLRSEVIRGLRQQPDASWDEIGRACGMTRQGAARRWSRHAQASSFGGAARRYERGRPEYPQPAIDWLIPDHARSILDLGAGTGKLTRSLLRPETAVTAVEPSQRKRRVLATAVPQALVLEGSAEHIPLSDQAVDVVVVGQAWHWFDTQKAIPEIARVLTAGGVLALVWNIRDETDPWVATLGQIMHQGTEQSIETSPEINHPFLAAQHTKISWQRTMRRDAILDMVASRSYVITLPADNRRQLLDDVSDHLSTHPDADRTEGIAMPYVTHCTRAQLGPSQPQQRGTVLVTPRPQSETGRV